MNWKTERTAIETQSLLSCRLEKLSPGESISTREIEGQQRGGRRPLLVARNGTRNSPETKLHGNKDTPRAVNGRKEETYGYIQVIIGS